MEDIENNPQFLEDEELQESLPLPPPPQSENVVPNTNNTQQPVYNQIPAPMSNKIGRAHV